jgi:hypothetical protein
LSSVYVRARKCVCERETREGGRERDFC